MEEQTQINTTPNPPANQLIGSFEGHVVEIKKYHFLCLFKANDGNVYGLKCKKRKLNVVQEKLLRIDAPVKIDFNTKKLSFKGEDGKYY